MFREAFKLLELLRFLSFSKLKPSFMLKQTSTQLFTYRISTNDEALASNSNSSSTWESRWNFTDRPVRELAFTSILFSWLDFSLLSDIRMDLPQNKLNVHAQEFSMMQARGMELQNSR